MSVRSTPTLTTCELCDVRMAAVRGPFSRNIGRPKPPQGYRVGFIVEGADGYERPMCEKCVALWLPSSVNRRNVA